jgi:hypothetical protein
VNAPRPLIELLGARWDMAAPVVGVAWDRSGEVAAFGLGDGTIALARRQWKGGPFLQSRQGGGTELVPAREAPPPVSRTPVHAGACLGVVADCGAGFLSGGDDGRLVRTACDGAVSELACFAGKWADPVAASGAGGWRACACGREVQVFGPRPQRIDLPSSASALAFDPAGRLLAMAHYGGVTLWSADDGQTRLLAWKGFHRALAWSPDAAYLVSGMQENALHGWRLADAGDIEMAGYPGQPLSLSFAADGRFLATGGGARAVCWRFDPPGSDNGPTECGIASRVPVTCVACHPIRPVIAVGHHNGAVLLCQPGVADILFVRGAGGAPVSALGWCPDGAALALGTEGGEVAVVTLPERLFRTQLPSTRETP